MPISLVSLMTPKLVWVVFGHPVDVQLGKAEALTSAMRGLPGEVLTLVKVKCVVAAGVCFPVDMLLVLPGAGTTPQPDDKCCCIEPDLLMWQVLPDTSLPELHLTTTSLSNLVSRHKRTGDVIAKGATIRFGNVQLNGSVISVAMTVRWTEDIFGSEVVLYDSTTNFSFDTGVQNPYPIHLGDFSVDVPFLGPVPVSVDATISVTLNPRQICADLRATWPGGNVGTRGCQGF